MFNNSNNNKNSSTSIVSSGRRNAGAGASSGGGAINGAAVAASMMSRSSGGGGGSIHTTTNNNNNKTKGGVSTAPSSNNYTTTSTSNNKTTFYPKLIASQIVALQCFHYFVLSIFFQINNVLYGTSITIDRIFTDQYIRSIWHGKGWPDTCAILLSSAVGAFLLVWIVEKSKKCLDFSVTLFFVHLWFTTMYNHGIPKAIEWWLVHIAGTILMVVLGEYLCSRKEMEDIPLLHL